VFVCTDSHASHQSRASDHRNSADGVVLAVLLEQIELAANLEPVLSPRRSVECRLSSIGTTQIQHVSVFSFIYPFQRVTFIRSRSGGSYGLHPATSENKPGEIGIFMTLAGRAPSLKVGSLHTQTEAASLGDNVEDFGRWISWEQALAFFLLVWFDRLYVLFLRAAVAPSAATFVM